MRATWDAESTRVTGRSDPEAWGGAAKAWLDLGCPHRAHASALAERAGLLRSYQS